MEIINSSEKESKEVSFLKIQCISHSQGLSKCISGEGKRPAGAVGGAATLPFSPVQGVGMGEPLSHHFWRSVGYNYKGTKRRSYPLFVNFSWEQQVEAALWFYFFTTGSYK
jgi:hypothetical protein